MAENSQDKRVVDLIAAIDSRLKKVHTQSLDLSFNELLDMKKNGELNITPGFQRLFQWTEGARSRFIESLLLEMSVPPIYVEELNGKTFDDLGTALQIRLKRAFVRVEVVRKGSDPRFQYHMFKRLNTGGQLLTEQQVRNCTIRLLSPQFNDYIIQLSKDDSFRLCTDTLSQERRLGAFDQELVLRFFAFRNYRDRFKHDVADFLTEYMEGVSDPDKPLPFDYESQKSIFVKAFTILAKALEDLAFAFANPNTKELGRGFSVYHYEALTIGLQSRLDNIDASDQAILSKLKQTFLEIKKAPEFIRITTGGGKNSPGPLRERISFVQKRIEAIV